MSRTGVVAHDDTNYGASFIYRGNITSSTSPSYAAMQYESTGVAVCTQNGMGTYVTAAPSSSTNYSLPGVVTPNSSSPQSTTVSYNSMWGPSSVVSPNGKTATTTYDSWGRPSQSMVPDGAETSYSYSYYPSANQQTAALLPSGSGVWKRTTLDGFGRVVRVENGTGATNNTPVSVVDTQYAPSGCSPMGQVYRVSMPYAGSGSPSAWTTYAYDERGRIASVTAVPDGSVTQYTYVANMTTITDPALKWKTQTFDAAGSLGNVTEPDTPNSFTNSTTYTYDGLNNLTGVTSQTASGTQTRSFTYSGLDRTTETNPENGTVNYTYDSAHHVLTKTDAIGQQTHYSYDTYGRLTAQYFYPLVSGVPTLDTNQTVLYYYDTNPHEPSFTTNSTGRLAAVQMNTSQWYEYNYSVPGRVTNQRLQVAGHDYDATYAWDSQGRLTSQTWPSQLSPSTGPTYTFQYDSMGRLGSMLDSSSTTQATASYGVANELTELTYFGIDEQRTYNNMFQLIRQLAPGGVIDMKYIYTAGQNNGRIAQSIDGYMPETVNYTYDSLNRLSNAAATSGAYSQSYTYDGFGNLTSKSAAGAYPAYSATFNPATNRQNGVAYDANGNQTTNGTYDVSNRLVTSTIGQSYAYDYRGKRTVKWMSGSAEVYFYGIDGRKLTTLTCDTSLNCSSAAYNVTFAGKLVQSKGYTVVTDRLGSVRWSSLGGVTGYIYFPYGEERTGTPNDTEKFGTYTRDSSGQDYADQRYYGVGTGRYWSPDPSGMASARLGSGTTWNRYLYVNGDPVNFNDARGLDPNCGPGKSWDGEGCIDSDTGEEGTETPTPPDPNPTDTGSGGNYTTSDITSTTTGIGGVATGVIGSAAGPADTTEASATATPVSTMGSDGQLSSGASNSEQGVSNTGTSNPATSNTGSGQTWPSTTASTCSYPAGSLLQFICNHAGNNPVSNSIRGCLQSAWISLPGYTGYISGTISYPPSMPYTPPDWVMPIQGKNLGLPEHIYCIPMGIFNH